MDKTQLAKYEKIAEQAVNAGQAAYADLSKWILASLLALNGGAVLVFVQISSAIPKLGPSLSPVLFLMGALFAVASGVCAQKRNLVVTEYFLKFLVAETDGERASKLEEGVKREILFERLASGSIFMSVLALVAGAILLWWRVAALSIPNPAVP